MILGLDRKSAEAAVQKESCNATEKHSLNENHWSSVMRISDARRCARGLTGGGRIEIFRFAGSEL
jgi:hypothetical protein